jgi:hypothetical protein
MLFAPLSNRDSVDFFVVGAGDESRHAIFSHQVTFLAQRVLLGRERSAHAFPIRLWINERTLAGSAADDDEDPVTITQPQAVWREPKKGSRFRAPAGEPNALVDVLDAEPLTPSTLEMLIRAGDAGARSALDLPLRSSKLTVDGYRPWPPDCGGLFR